jgi:helicase MOV-10
MEAASANLLSLHVPGLSENRPSLLRGDQIFARIYPTGKNSEPEDKEYEGVVHEVWETKIGVGFSQELKNR